LKILVTGGLGYIGSHVSVLLLEKGYKVVIVDNLDNSSISVLDGIKKITNLSPVFEKLDVRDFDQMESLFSRHKDFTGVIHFAAYKAVGESVEDPLKYYDNNVLGFITLFKFIKELKIPLIFSSSATVYGDSDSLPIKEDAPIKEAFSPYGKTKQICEEIIRDTTKSNSLIKSVILRYFNPIGAHPSSLIGELPNGEPQNLIPFITQTLIGKKNKLMVYGNDYPTIDGTCIRDYIHVMDLAEAHIRSLEYILDSKNKNNFEVINIGTGQGYSVLQIIDVFEKVTKIKIKYTITSRRQGDVAASYSDCSKAKQILGWTSKLTIEDSIASSWNWEKNN
tara:strand:+ start:169 stop:1176 length:1008 start_codon:yes stop_codon:yes gene_type:complete